jgi:hypothetical protein
MQVIEKEQEFKPIEMTIKLDSLEEAKWLYFVFNYWPLVSLVGSVDTSAVAIRQFLALNSDCNNAVDFDRFRTELERYVKEIK